MPPPHVPPRLQLQHLTPCLTLRSLLNELVYQWYSEHSLSKPPTIDRVSTPEAAVEPLAWPHATIPYDSPHDMAPPTTQPITPPMTLPITLT